MAYNGSFLDDLSMLAFDPDVDFWISYTLICAWVVLFLLIVVNAFFPVGAWWVPFWALGNLITFIVAAYLRGDHLSYE